MFATRSLAFTKKLNPLRQPMLNHVFISGSRAGASVFSTNEHKRRIEQAFLAKLLDQAIRGAGSAQRVHRAVVRNPEILAGALDEGVLDPFIEQQVQEVRGRPFRKFADVEPVRRRGLGSPKRREATRQGMTSPHGVGALQSDAYRGMAVRW
jgi:hypothetical protein